MIKKLLLAALFFSLPVYAGIYDNAMSGKKDVLMYMYTQHCGTCKKFTPIYNKIAETHKDLNCIKIDAYTPEGMELAKKYGVSYVPYVMLLRPGTTKHVTVNPYCTFNIACVDRVIRGFTN